MALSGAAQLRAADPEIDKLLQSPVGKDWVTNGGNLTNQRYSTLKQIDTTNVKQLKGAWMTRLKGSGFGGKYSAEATPLVKDGIMYVVTGNDDVFALNAKTGEMLWERWSGIDQKISTVCCGWLNRGLAMGEGMLFLGQLDANVVALDIKTGKEVWKTPIEDWRNGYGVTSAPLYYDGIVYSGNTGGEFGVRSRLTALDAKTGKILWRWYTLPGPGEVGSDTWPAGTDHAMRGGASIWNTPALDPQLGLIYFATGNCGPDYDGSMREGDNLFCASIVALNAKTGEHVWHFQEVHHDIWDYDAASPVVLFDTVINGQPRKGIAEAGRTGWVYILDRTNGKPLIGIEERPVPQEPRQKTAKTQPYPIGDATVPQCAQPMEGYEKAGCIFEAFWDEPVLIQPSGQGGTNWSPMPYDPDTGYLYVPGTIRTSVFSRVPSQYTTGQRYTNGTQAPPIGSPLSGTFTAIDSQDEQDRLATQDALSHGRRRRLDRHRRRSPVPRRARRQLRRARRQDRRGAVEVPDRLWRRCTGDGLRGRRRPVHRDCDRRQFDPRQRLRRCGLGLLAQRTARSAMAATTAADRRRARRRDRGRRRQGQDRRQQRRVRLFPGPHPGQGGNHRDLHQCRRHSAHGDGLRQGQGRRLGHRRSGQGRIERRSLSTNPAPISTSARRTRGCTVRSIVE